MKDAKEILVCIQDFEKGQGGFLNTYLLQKESITIYNNSGDTVAIQIDKDMFTDGGGCDLEPGETDGSGRSGRTNVLVNGKSAGNLAPGSKYVVEPGGEVVKVA